MTPRTFIINTGGSDLCLPFLSPTHPGPNCNPFARDYTRLPISGELIDGRR